MNEFQNYMYLYLKKTKLKFCWYSYKTNFNKWRRNKNFWYKNNKKINFLKKDEAFLKMDYLTIMVLGITGIWKSTLVNSL